MAPLRVGLNHVLKNSPSTDGCQHMVEIVVQPRYAGPMPTDMTDLEELVASLLESGRMQAVIGVSDEPDRSLTALRFANILRRSADRLCHEAAEVARGHGASWRQIGESVGGITPQGAEHRFSRAAKERRAKASKVVWAGKERRVPTAK
jgi:hypothetical protein